MTRVFSRKSNKARILLCTFILTFAILQVSPVEVTAAVTASTNAISEGFTNTTYMDSLETNASWWRDGSVRIPEKIARYTGYCEITDFGVEDIYIDGTMLLLANQYFGIDIVNISDPAHPAFVTHLPVSNAWGVSVSGNWMYVASSTLGLRVYNITDYQNPQWVSTFGPSHARDVHVEGSYAYLATYDQGIQVFDVTNPQSIVSVANYTNIDCNAFIKITKEGDYLFACEGSSPGIHIVNVTDPTDPTNVSRCETSHYTYNVIIVNDYVFGTASGDLFAMSISNISNPHIVNSAYGGVPSGNGVITIEDGYVYLCAAAGGLRMVDISDPYDLRVNLVNQTMESWYTIANDGFVYTTGHIDATYTLEAHKLEWAYNAEASSLSVYEAPLDTFSITQATLTASDSTPASTSISYYLSADNGTHWEEVVPGTLHSFSNLGTILKWKAVLDTTSPTYTPEISSVNISIRIQLNPIALHAVSVTPDYNKPSFTWDDLEGADGYRFQLDILNTFDSPNLIDEVIDAIDTNLYEIETALDNGTYYYRMAAIDEDGDTGIFTNTRHVLIGTTSTTTTTTSTNGTGVPLDPMILAIGAISIVGLVVVVVIIQKKKSS